MRTIPALATAALLTLAAPAGAATLFRALLMGGQEVPPVASGASGQADLLLNDAQDRLEISISLSGLDLDGLQTADPNDDVVALHIHRAPAGVNGSVVFGMINPSSDLNGDLTVDAVAGSLFSGWDLGEGNGTTLAAELANLFAEGLYVNVHTPANPGGELRGQIAAVVPEPSAALVFALGWLLCGASARRG